MNENNTSDDAKIGQGVQYAVGDICMVSQTNKCIQFHPVSLTRIAEHHLSIIYLTTKARDIIPIGPQVRSLYQVGRYNKRSRVRTPSLSSLEQRLPNEYSPRHEGSITKVYITDTNTYNNIIKIYCDESSIYNLSLARWKRQRKYHIWSK